MIYMHKYSNRMILFSVSRYSIEFEPIKTWTYISDSGIYHCQVAIDVILEDYEYIGEL